MKSLLVLLALVAIAHADPKKSSSNYCREIYAPTAIATWIDAGQTAMCPRCSTA